MSHCPRCGAVYETGVSRCADCDVALEEREPMTPARDPEAREGMAVAYVTTDESQAAMVSQLLEAGGVENFTTSEHTLLPFTVSKLGNVRVHVLQSDLERARRIIAELETGESAPPSDG